MEIELRAYVRTIRKRIVFIIMIVFFSCLTTGFVNYFMIKPIYSASAMLLVNNFTNTNDSNDADAIRSNMMLMQTYIELLKTSAVLEKVIEQNVGLHLTEEELISKMEVNAVKGTQIINVSIHDTSVEEAAQLLKSILENFQAEIVSSMKINNILIMNQVSKLDESNGLNLNPIHCLVIAFILSFMVAVSLSLFLEYMDDTMKSEFDVAHSLELPVLGTITKMKRAELRLPKRISEINMINSE